MKYRKMRRNIFMLDSILFVLSCISLIVFTGFYLCITQDIRNVFLLFDIFGIITLVDSVNGIEDYIETGKVKKCSRIRVNQKLFYSRCREVQKMI